jgi:hypothetical protein
MAKVISVGGLATAGVLVAAGAAVNRLFRPFDATVPRAERVAEPLVLTFPISPRESLDDLVAEPVRGTRETVPSTRPSGPTRPARPGPALLTRRGSRKAWRCV